LAVLSPKIKPMAEFDYALLANYASIPGGQLTAVGASFTQIALPSVPRSTTFSLAGRVLVPESDDGFELGVAINGPDNHPIVEFDGFLDSGQSSPIDGNRGTLFAMQITIEVAEFGKHTVSIKIDGDVVKILRFDVVNNSNDASQV